MALGAEDDDGADVDDMGFLQDDEHPEEDQPRRARYAVGVP